MEQLQQARKTDSQGNVCAIDAPQTPIPQKITGGDRQKQTPGDTLRAHLQIIYKWTVGYSLLSQSYLTDKITDGGRTICRSCSRQAVNSLCETINMTTHIRHTIGGIICVTSNDLIIRGTSPISRPQTRIMSPHRNHETDKKMKYWHSKNP